MRIRFFPRIAKSLRRNPQQRTLSFELCEPRRLLAVETVLVDNFLAQPLPEEVAAGREFAFYNVVGGDRGEVFNLGGGEINWAPGQVEARVLQTGQFAGIFESVNHVLGEGLPLDFNALLGSQIDPKYQHRATAIVVDLDDGIGNFKVELKSPANGVLFVQNTTLVGGERQLRFTLPNPAPSNVQAINLVSDGTVGNFFVASRIAIETEGADAGADEPFVWTYANLLYNYDPETGLVRDRANFPSGDFDNVSATGGFALASVLAANRGVIANAAAMTIVEEITDAVLNLPRLHGVLPHFVTGTINPQIKPDTEWSSLDTVLTYAPLLLARQALNLPTDGIESAFSEIDWDELTLGDGTISHGYDFAGTRLESGWNTFGGETFMAVWAHAAANPGSDLAAVPMADPPTWTGSGFIDELAALYLPMPENDIWGTNWPEFRTQAAAAQVAHYADLPTCCASAAEVPEPWDVPAGQDYQAFGINGRIPDNDGTALIGYRVAAPHYPAMIASLEPAAAEQNWEFLKAQGAVSPLNVVESVYVLKENNKDRAVWNPLKGSWNLLLATLGYERALAGEENYLPYQAARQNKFAFDGLIRLAETDRVGYHRNNAFAVDVNGNGVWQGPAGGDAWYFFGQPGDTPIIGDWDGDGIDDIGYQRSNYFALDKNGNGIWEGPAAGDALYRFGQPGDTPLIGDWDGDGDDDIGYQRSNYFALDLNGNGVWQGSAGGDALYRFGQPGDTPLIGDWDGDGNDDIGYQRSNYFALDLNGNGIWQGAAGGDALCRFGQPGDMPLIGDWDGDGDDDIGYQRSNYFALDKNGNGIWQGAAGGDALYRFGQPGDTPIIGNWAQPSPLLAAGGPVFPSSDLPDLTADALPPIVDHAVAVYRAETLTPAQQQQIDRLDVRIADLPGATLGQALGTTITIDLNAAGYGWFVDPTPGQDEEFTLFAENEYRANRQSEIGNRQSFDLLTVVMHEIGHVLGYGHDEGDAMAESLSPGVRRVVNTEAFDRVLAALDP